METAEHAASPAPVVSLSLTLPSVSSFREPTSGLRLDPSPLPSSSSSSSPSPTGGYGGFAPKLEKVRTEIKTKRLDREQKIQRQRILSNLIPEAANRKRELEEKLRQSYRPCYELDGWKSQLQVYVDARNKKLQEIQEVRKLRSPESRVEKIEEMSYIPTEFDHNIRELRRKIEYEEANRKVEDELREDWRAADQQHCQLWNESVELRKELGDPDYLGSYPESQELLALCRRRQLLENEVLLDELLPEYRAFALEHGIKVLEDEHIYKMVADCNRLHQTRLLENHFVEKPCPERGGRIGECRGWYVRKHRCECDNYKGWSWDDHDFDPSDLTAFNIRHTEPYGEPERT